MNQTVTALPTIEMRQTKVPISECKICGDAAQYSYYGAIVCQSCKIFFKRNALCRRNLLKCHFNNDCDINVKNRHICSACRIEKCFVSGMCVEMIRASRSNNSNRNEEKNLISDSVALTSTTLMIRNNQNQSEQIPISNLLKSDQSTLSIEQWNLISNLVHCFDEYSGYSHIKHYIHDQNALPPKARYKYLSVGDFLTSMLVNVQSVFEKNRNFCSLTLHDRSTLLRTTAKYTSSIGGLFLMSQNHLLDNECFYKSAEMIFRPTAVALSKCNIDRLDPDGTFVKLTLAIFALLTINCTTYAQSDSINLVDIKSIVSIQNMYTELVWRYLLYKYNHREAVIRFSNLVRCFIFVNDAITEANESQEFIRMIDNIIEQTDQTLRLQ